MAEDILDAQSPYIKISRSGSVTRVAATGDERPHGAATPYLERAFDDDDEGGTVTLRETRPMPKRLSEEVRGLEEAARRRQEDEEAIAEDPAPKQKKARTTRKKKSTAASEAEQIALPLKTPKEKPDTMVKQRQVLGLACIVAAVLVMIAIVTYSSDDAAISETKISDLPTLFIPGASDAPDPVRDQIRAAADLVHNKLGLIGAMLANFLINKTIGYAAILYPLFFGAWSLAFFRFTYRQRRRLTLATTFFLLTAILFSATMGTAANFASIPREWFGSVGQFLGLAFARAIGGAGAFIIYATAFVVMLVFSIDLDIEKTAKRLHDWWNIGVMFARRKMIEFWDQREARQAEKAERRAAELAEEAAREEEELLLKNEELGVRNEELEIPEAEVPTPKEEVETVAIKRPKVKEEQPFAKAVPPIIAEAIAPGLAKAVEAPTIETPASESIPNTALPIANSAASTAPVAAVTPTAQFVPGQPLLKVRPAPKPGLNAQAPIPRITQNANDKLGGRSMHFTRLTNGAVEEQKAAAPIPAAAPAAMVAPPENIPSPVSDELRTDEIANIDPSVEMISPLAAPVKKEKPEQKIVVKHEAPVQLGDEKALSNEALPHSVASESLLPPVPPSKIIERVSDDLFQEEGEKAVVPENPYMEMLGKYRNPPLDILTPSDPRDMLDANDEELAKKGRLLRDKLATFGVEIENITVTPGPVVTLYEFTPAEGVKVSRVENLTDDIALAMKARGIRIIAPIPGKGTIGVEIPNDVAKMVRIREMFESESFKKTKMNLPLALGKTISGDVYVDDLNRMPHLLIAGATGSGKSVGVNGIIASLLYAKSPRDVKFVIVDPKKIELSLYKKLRKHYLIVSPEAGEEIVTTPAYAVLALKAVEIEMEKRYDKLAKAAVRSLADYNVKVAQGRLRSTQDEQHYHLPYIVVVIDELADLMITAAREIEEPICRIAQMARAVGIHLILATQRPSVDVITGVIKANFPARMAFQVATRVDSRTILDGMGAEQLLGNGDMLYQPSGTPKPIRLQSPFISTEEVEAMIDAIADQEGPGLSYSRTWTLPSLRTDRSSSSVYEEEEDSRDELFEEAAKVIVRHQQGSVSLLQRRLKVGYSRAARIVDELEQAGIVGPFDGSKAREVLCESEAELEVVLEGLR